MLLFLECRVFIWIIWNFLNRRFVPSPQFVDIFNHLFISVWPHGYLFYIWGYNSILLYYFYGSNCCSLALWHTPLLSWVLVFHSVLFCLALPYLLTLQDAPSSPGIFSAPASESPFLGWGGGMGRKCGQL